MAEPDGAVRAAGGRLRVLARAAGPPALAILGAAALSAAGGPPVFHRPAAQAGAVRPAALNLAGRRAGSWPVYHGNLPGTGVARTGTVSTTRRAWASPRLDGELYGEPLISGGRVYAATEDDTVYALSAATGAVTWSAHLGRPVPASTLPCGDITPVVGITGTPVIDPGRDEIFVVADELRHGHPAHVLAGLSAATGRIELTRNVDPPGAQVTALLQRTGLTLAGGRVVFGFGGNDGDCPRYRGHVVAVPETGNGPVQDYTVDSGAGESQGAVWMGGGAPAVSSRGDVLVTAGNGSVRTSRQPYDHSDSVLQLSPSMHLIQFFAPVTWAADNASDQDLSTEPALLAGGLVLAAGKSDTVYLLRAARLGGIGGQLAELRGACGGVIDGGFAVQARTAYLPCAGGILAVRASAAPPALRTVWKSAAGGGPPIVAGGLVWTISQAGTLSGLDPATGAVRRRAQLGFVANHFATPAAAGRLLVAATARRVVAFPAGSAAAARPRSGSPRPGHPGTGSPPGATTAAHPHRGTFAPAAIAGLAVAAAAAVAAVGLVIRARRRDTS